MLPLEFFRTGIADNNYQGYKLEPLELKKDFNCNTRGSRTQEEHRRKGVRNFIIEIYDLIAKKNISELNISQITFDEEFEANKYQKIFDISGNNFANLKIYTGNIVGSIIYKSNHFNINCRFGNQFLKYMIANTSGFLELENFGDIDKECGIGEWILIYYWRLLLKKAFSLGLYKTYQHRKENLHTVKGVININSMLKKNFFDGKTVCNFKEHSYKNELNAVIQMALAKVFKSKYLSIVSDIYDIKNAFDSINNPKLNLNSIRSQKVINPYFRKYNQVFEFSLKILRDEFANAGGKNTDLSAFLFDISLLFEHHIRKILKQQFTLFIKNKHEFSIPNGIDENKIFPDVIIDCGNNKIKIYDVKYKKFNFTYGVNREDRFQLITYVATHLQGYEVIECGIIYPLEVRESKEEKPEGENKQTYIQTLRVCNKEIPFEIKFYPIRKEINKQSEADKNFLESFSLE